MKHFKIVIFTILSILLFNNCHSQGQDNNDNANSRTPKFAGKFYPADKTELTKQLNTYFANAKSRQDSKVAAIISPHAGYVYSGNVAASSYNQVDPGREIENVFLIGPSHRYNLNGASVYKGSSYKTPLGSIPVNTKIANTLISNNDIFTYKENAHKKEHSLEVQLPFLQHHLNNAFKIIPVLCNSRDTEALKNIAGALEQYMDDENLFVISSDFSHYPDYQGACKADSLSAKAIVSKKPANLQQQIRANTRKNIQNLKTSMCGYSGIMSLLYMIQDNPEYEINMVEYKNSGDTRYGKKNRVVGYWAMDVVKKNNSKPKQDNNQTGFNITPEAKEQLLHIARKTLTEYINTGKKPQFDTSRFTDLLLKETGCFVTLNKNQRLRGCMGNFIGTKPLYKLTREMTITAATRDPRFQTVGSRELENIDIEISVLTPLKEISSLDEFQLGKHGIYIKKGRKTGTYLPQVADQKEWTKEEFIRHCAVNKAGMNKNGWKNAELYTYKALVFSEDELKE